MTLPVAVSAPGKLFLIGEYAVLEGAPALLTAVDRRVHVTIERSPDNRWRITAANLGLDDVALERNGTLPATLDSAVVGALSVFDAVRATLAEALALDLPPLAVDIDSTDFVHDGHKLGLGSSAAVAAALAYALVLAADREIPRAQLAALAIAAHRRAQNGTGSGGDVAASVYGGVIRYVRNEPPMPLAWPHDLVGMVVVTGDGASTANMVARVHAYGERDPDGYAADIAALTRLADKAAQELTPTLRFLRLADEYFAALQALDCHADAGIISDHHRRLYRLAAEHRAVFKTSGAGGGDVGLVFARRGAEGQAARRALEDAEAQVLPLIFSAPGLRAESTYHLKRERSDR